MQSKIPLGYEIVDGVAKVHKTQKKTVNLIFKEYLNGKSLNFIANYLKEKQTPNASGNVSWTHGTVAKILENQKYLGDNFYPKLVDELTFEKVQQLRHKNKKSIRKKEIEVEKIYYPSKPKTIFIPKEIRQLDDEILVNPCKELIFKRAEMLYKTSKIYDIGGNQNACNE